MAKKTVEELDKEIVIAIIVVTIMLLIFIVGIFVTLNGKIDEIGAKPEQPSIGPKCYSQDGYHHTTGSLGDALASEPYRCSEEGCVSYEKVCEILPNPDIAELMLQAGYEEECVEWEDTPEKNAVVGTIVELDDTSRAMYEVYKKTGEEKWRREIHKIYDKMDSLWNLTKKCTRYGWVKEV